MKAALKSGVEKGELIQVKMSYKLSADAKKVLKKGPAKKKAAPKKKTTVTKKKTAPKKKAAPKKKVSSLSIPVLPYLVGCCDPFKCQL